MNMKSYSCPVWWVSEELMSYAEIRFPPGSLPGGPESKQD